jgi:hypothetical protein
MRKRDTFDKEQRRKRERGRDSERNFEEVIGDLLISQFQTEMIRAKLAGKVEGYRHAAAGYYYKEEEAEKSSCYQFQHKGKLYRVSISVDRMPGLRRSRLEQLVESLDPDAAAGGARKEK